MNKNPTISAIIPTHNRPELLKRALDSALHQTRQVNEIIVVDDTEDGTASHVVSSILTHHGGIPIRYIHRVTGPVGASASRNAGASEATCQMLAFLDDDDWWKAQHIALAIEQVNRRGVPLVVSQLEIVDESGVISRGPLFGCGLKPRQVVTINPGFMGSNFVIDAEVFRCIGGFDAKLPVSNDLDLLVRLLIEGVDYGVVATPTVVYTRHSGPQLTKKSRVRADGLRLYREKHSALLTLADRRRLASQIFRMEAATSRPSARRAAYIFLSLMTADINEIVPAIRRRLFKKQPRNGSW